MAQPGSSPASTSPAYSSLAGTNYQRYVNYIEAVRGGARVNPRYVSNLVENVKSNIRNLGTLRYLTGEKGEQVRRQIAELKQVRSELTQLRDRSGGSVSMGLPASNPGSEYYEPPKPLAQQPVRTPFGTFSPGKTPFQQLERRQGPVYESYQKNIGQFERTPPEERPFVEYHLTSNPLAGLSPIQKAESFVGGINAMYEGRQVLIATKQGDTYSVQYNPALAKSGVQDLVAERLTGLGFREIGGKFVYTEPSYEAIYEAPEYGLSVREFDFAQPFVKESDVEPTAPNLGSREKAILEGWLKPSDIEIATEGPQKGFAKDGFADFGLSILGTKGGKTTTGPIFAEHAQGGLEYPDEFDLKERERQFQYLQGKGAYDVVPYRIDPEFAGTTDFYMKGSREATFYDPNLNIGRQFFASDYSKGAQEFVHEILTPKELTVTTTIGEGKDQIVSRVPVAEKDRREFGGGGLISAGVGYLGESVENYLIKPGVAALVVGKGTLTSSLHGGSEVGVREAGDVYAAYPDFNRLPSAVTTLAAFAFEPGATSAVAKAGKEAGQKAVFGFSRIARDEAGRAFLETELGQGQVMTGYLSEREIARAGAETFFRNIGKVASDVARPAAGIASESIKFGAFGAGAQTAMEFGVGAIENAPPIVAGRAPQASSQKITVDGQEITIRDPLQAANPAGFFIMQAEAAAPQILLPPTARLDGAVPYEAISEFRQAARGSGFIPGTDFETKKSGYAKLTGPSRAAETARIFGTEGTAIFNTAPFAGGGVDALAKMFRGGLERLRSPQARDRILAAGAGFAIIGAGAGAAKQGPVVQRFFSDKVTNSPYSKLGNQFGSFVKQIPSTVRQVPLETEVFLSSAYFLANAPQKSLPGGKTDSAGYNLAQSLTQRGVNPFSPVKPIIRRAKEEAAPREVGVSFIQPPAPFKARPLSAQASPGLRNAISSGMRRDFNNAFFGRRGYDRAETFGGRLNRRLTEKGIRAIPIPKESPAGEMTERQIEIRQENINQAIISERGRLKVEVVALMREGLRTGQRGGLRQRLGQRENENVLLGQFELTGQFEPELTRVPTRERLRVPQRTKPPPPTLLFPPLPKTEFDEARKRVARPRKRLSKKDYAASVYGIEFKVTASKVPKGILGVGVRPLVVGRRRRK